MKILRKGFQIALCWAALASLQAAPVPDKFPAGAWDSTSVTARFDDVMLGTVTQHMVFFYILKNNTDADYTIADQNSAQLFAVGPSGGGQLLPQEQMHIRYPIVVHAHQVQIIELSDQVHDYVVNDRLRENPKEPELRRYETFAYAAIRKSWPELRGFRLYDSSGKRLINLPRGWASGQPPPG
jgi:hypothetical protein